MGIESCKIYKYKNNLTDHFVQIDWNHRFVRKIYKDGIIGFWADELISVMKLEDYVIGLVELNNLELNVLKAQGILNDYSK